MSDPKAEASDFDDIFGTGPIYPGQPIPINVNLNKCISKVSWESANTASVSLTPKTVEDIKKRMETIDEVFKDIYLYGQSAVKIIHTEPETKPEEPVQTLDHLTKVSKKKFHIEPYVWDNPSKPKKLLDIGTKVKIRPDSQYINQSREWGEITHNSGLTNGCDYIGKFPHYGSHYYNHQDFLIEEEVPKYAALFAQREIAIQEKTIQKMGLLPMIGMKVRPHALSQNAIQNAKGGIGEIVGTYLNTDSQADVRWEKGLKTVMLDSDSLVPHKLGKRQLAKALEFKAKVDAKKQQDRAWSARLDSGKDVWVAHSVHDFLARRLEAIKKMDGAVTGKYGTVEKTEKYFPEVFVLVGNEMTVTHILKLPYQGKNGGCQFMPTVSRKELALAYGFLAKKKIQPIGFAKVGIKFDPATIGGQSNSIYLMGGIVINFAEAEIVPHTYGSNFIYYNYVIQRIKTRNNIFIMDDTGLITTEAR